MEPRRFRAAHHPHRAQCLAREPLAPQSVKSHSLSYQAKWHPDDGAFFYERLWQDEKVRAELRKRLEATGAWAVVEALVAD